MATASSSAWTWWKAARPRAWSAPLAARPPRLPATPSWISSPARNRLPLPLAPARSKKSASSVIAVPATSSIWNSWRRKCPRQSFVPVAKWIRLRRQMRKSACSRANTPSPSQPRPNQKRRPPQLRLRHLPLLLLRLRLRLRLRLPILFLPLPQSRPWTLPPPQFSPVLPSCHRRRPRRLYHHLHQHRHLRPLRQNRPLRPLHLGPPRLRLKTRLGPRHRRRVDRI